MTDPAAFCAAVQLTRMPMVLADPNLQDCPVVYCNDAFCEMMGYERAEILGRNCRFLQGSGTDEKPCGGLPKHWSSAGMCTRISTTTARMAGDFGSLYEISPVFDEDGSLRFFFGSQIDITWRREAELLQAKQIESIRALSTGVAHEFNNLMTAVVGSVAQAMKQAVDPRQRQRLERAAWAAQRAGEQASQLLDLAQRQSAASSLVDRAVQRSGMRRRLRRRSRPPMAARKRSWASELRRLDLRMLKAKLRSLAKTPGLMRMRERSSPMVTSRL